MKKSESIIELGTALALAQAEMSNPAKNAKNPFFKSSYADLAEVINISKPTLAKFGLSIIQMPYAMNGHVGVETMIIHKTGEYISSRLNMPLGAKKDAQAVGSAITYARRYSLAAMAGIAQEDDDGKEATKSSSKEPAHLPKVAKAAINKACKELDQYFAITVSESAAEVAKIKARADALILFKRAEKSEVTQVYDKYLALFKRKN